MWNTILEMIFYLLQDMLNLFIMAQTLFLILGENYWIFCSKTLKIEKIFSNEMLSFEVSELPMQFVYNLFSRWRVYLVFSCSMICDSVICIFYPVVMVLKAILKSIFWKFHSVVSVVGFNWFLLSKIIFSIL